MAGAARIAEFFASVGFQADEKSLKSALTKVAAFGASVSVLAGGVFASLVGIAKAEADIAAQADKLGTSSERLEELRYVAEQTGSSADKLTGALESIASKNPRIKDTAAAFDLVSDRMRGMSELQRKLYAQRLGIDPTLIPMMTDDVAGLREEFRAMYAVAGTDAKAAAEESKGFLNELAKLKTLSGMLAKAVGLAFIGKIRRDIENLRRVIMENFGKIQRILQIVIGFVMRVAGAIGAFVYRIIKWAGQLVGWFDSLDDGQKKLVIGVGLLIAAWKMLNLAFLTTPLGMLITGLAGIVALVDDYLTYMESGESYFDWGPWAGTIERCVSVLKDVWNVIYAVGAAIGSALGPAFAMIVEQLAWLSRTIGYVAHILYQVFTGDLSGALETAKTMLADWGETGKRLVALLCQTIGNFFSRLWEGVVADFPDFGKWAEGAGESIKRGFSHAISRVKEKLRGLIDMLPDWVLEKIGWKNEESVTPDARESAPAAETAKDSSDMPSEKKRLDPKSTYLPPIENPYLAQSPEVLSAMRGKKAQAENPMPWRNPYMPPSGPAIVPTAAQRANMTTNNRSMKIDAKTEITVNGAQSPAETAKNVARQQTNVNADLVRHAQGAAQ